MATKKKMRRFADGGVAEGQNPNIDDDVRARALKFVENASEESRDLGEPITKSASTSSNKTTISKTAAPPVKPKGETPEEYKARMEDLVKKQGIERVEPENYVPGPGLVRGLLKNAMSKGMKTAGREALPSPSAVKMLENKSTKMLSYDKAGDLAAKRAARAEARDVEMKRGNAKNYGLNPDDLSQSVLDTLRKNIGGGKFSMKKGGKVSSYKSGGSVKTSASKRADGCAIRGKTRA